jgi:hypothetical protein
MGDRKALLLTAGQRDARATGRHRQAGDADEATDDGCRAGGGHPDGGHAGRLRGAGIRGGADQEGTQLRFDCDGFISYSAYLGRAVRQLYRQLTA